MNKKKVMYFPILTFFGITFFTFISLFSQEILKETDPLFPILRNDKFGFVNREGKMVIEPRFDGANYFSEGLSCVKIGKKYGFIDKTGKFVIQPKYDLCLGFSDGIAMVQVVQRKPVYSWKNFFIDKSENTVLSPPFESFKSFFSSFSEGLALIKVDEKWGYMDKQGKAVIQPQFDSAGYFSEGLAHITLDGKPAYIDKSGKVVLKPKIDSHWGGFHEGLAAASVGKKWGFIDKKGRFVIQPQFESAGSFSEGLGTVQTENLKWGLIDKKGQIVISPKYDAIGAFIGGIAQVYIGNTPQLINKSGEIVAVPQDEKALAALTHVLKTNAKMPQPSGLYQLEQKITFNVLDKVVLNPKTGQITLMGHFDEKYFGPRIPYLQHLATLLENPKPEFSLKWTPESEQKVDAFFRRLDSIEEVKKISYQLGRVVDDNGRVTVSGRWLLPLWGVKPPNVKASDPWVHADRYYIISEILGAAGKKNAQFIVLLSANAASMAKGNPTYQEKNDLYNALIFAVGAHDVHVDLDNKLRSGQITQYQAFLGLHRAIFSGMDREFGLTGQPLLRAYDNTLPTGGTDGAFSAAMTELGDRQLYGVLEKILESFFARYDEFRVPPHVMYAAVGIRPEVMPAYMGGQPRSQLARVLFTSDYIGKHLANFPQLKKKIPAYQTEFEFNRSHPQTRRTASTSTHHMWISVDKLSLAQSSDGFTLETRDARMRFNIREIGAGGKDARHAPGSYEELLTSLYDDLSKEFPILHELRECAKLTGAALWLRERKPDVKLPKSGRLAWNGPSKVAGVMYMTWSPKPKHGAVNVSMMAMGGVTLVPPVGEAVAVWPPEVNQMAPKDSSVADMQGNESVIVPEIYDNQVLKKMLKRTVIVPVPPVAGWVGGATKGQRLYQAVSALPVPEEFDSEKAFELQNKLEELKALTFHLRTVDHAVNLLNQAGYKGQLQLAELEKELQKARDENIEIAWDSVESLLFQLPGFLKDKGLLKNMGAMGDLLGKQIEKQNPEKIELAWNTFKEVRDSEGVEQKLNVLEHLYTAAIKVEGAPPALAKTLTRANMALDIANTANDAYKVTHNLYKLYTLNERMKRGTAEADEWYAEMDRLTKMQKGLNDRVDTAMKDPAIVQWLEQGK